MRPRVLYLHGFASGPGSYKGRALAADLAPRGYEVEQPDLNLPSFERLSLVRQQNHVREMLQRDGRPTVLVGSSLGGYLAALLASEPEHAHLAALLLLAPAFDLAARWRARLGPDALAQWVRDGAMEYPHHTYGRALPLHHAFLEEAATLPAMPDACARVTVVQGRRDESVPHTIARAWVDQNPHAKLVELDDDHQLIASLPVIRHELDLLLADAASAAETRGTDTQR